MAPVFPKMSHPEINYYTIPSFTFASGETLSVTLAFTQQNPSAPLKALVPTCYGGRIASTLNFSNASTSALSAHNLVTVAMLGNGESSSPSNTADFPRSLDYRDQINAQYTLLTQHLGWSSLDVVVGFSMGGQQAYYWAAMYPDFVKRSVCICGSARTSPHNYAFLEGPIAALERSEDYAGGALRTNGKGNGKPVKGLRGFERAYIAWLYSADWYRAELWKQTTGAQTIAEFMEKFEMGIVAGWDPEDVLILARQWQNGDVGVVGGGYEKTLAGIKAAMLVMPCKTDQYFPPDDSEIEVKHLKKGTLAVMPSVWGHAAGGGSNPEDATWMDEKIKEFLKA